MNLSGNPFLLPGIGLKTRAGDHFPIEQMVLQRWPRRLEELRRDLGLPHGVGRLPRREAGASAGLARAPSRSRSASRAGARRASRPARRGRGIAARRARRVGSASSRTSPVASPGDLPVGVCVCSWLRREETARRQPTADGRPPPSFSARPSTTSWPRRGACAPRSRALVTYSPKVFIPLTTLCRDVCGYCTFARPPRRGERAYLTEDEVLAIARAGAAAGCTEALFTLGDKPELRYKVARDELAALGCETTLEYLGALREARARGDGAAAASEPRRDDPRGARRAAAGRLRRWGSCSRRSAERLSAQGRPALGLAGQGAAAPARDDPARRRARIPFTSGILIGIGETRAERIDALLALRALARAARPPPGGDRPELPRQAGHAHGRPPGRDARRAPLDDRRRAARARPERRTSRRRRTSPTTTSRACSTPGSTTGAASRR